MSDAVVKQRASVYTVMLVVSFLCLVMACLFLYFEMDRFEFMTKVPEGLRAKGAEAAAQAAEAMADPAAPMADPAAPMADPAAPMADPAAPADPAAAPVDPAAAPMPAMPAEPAM
jgi:hypothetical protein